MIGIVPGLKRPDRALDTLELLLERDRRYRLRIKGPSPFDYPWLLDRPAEVEYYRALYRRINSGPLRYAVIFDPPGANVHDWLSLVGFILSPSDYESFHMAVAEGMLTGCQPVVWERDGIHALWPAESIVTSAAQAADLIEKAGRTLSAPEFARAREYIRLRYDSEITLARWTQTLLTPTPAAV